MLLDRKRLNYLIPWEGKGGRLGIGDQVAVERGVFNCLVPEGKGGASVCVAGRR